MITSQALSRIFWGYAPHLNIYSIFVECSTYSQGQTWSGWALYLLPGDSFPGKNLKWSKARIFYRHLFPPVIFRGVCGGRPFLSCHLAQLWPRLQLFGVFFQVDEKNECIFYLYVYVHALETLFWWFWQQICQKYTSKKIFLIWQNLIIILFLSRKN